MKKSILFIAVNFLFGVNYAIETGAVVKEVVVYQNSARIMHEAGVSVPAGNSEVVITELSSYLQQNSLQVEIEGSAIILSASSRMNYLTGKEQSARIKSLQDSLVLIDNQLKSLAGEKLVYIGEENLINANNKLGSEQSGMVVSELKTLAEFYRTRLLDIKKQVIGIENREKEFQQVKSKIQNQLNDMNASAKQPTSEVVINVAANALSKIKIKLSYLVGNAGWYPLYDIRSESVSKPIHLIYKANVYQSTGFDWNNIKLSVSTRNPVADQNRPVLNPWFIDFYELYSDRKEMYRSKAAGVAAESNVYLNMAADEDAELAPAPEYIVTETTGLLSAEYAIENLQDIPSDGKEHLVAMKEYEVPAAYTYHSVPKLSDGVFLIAKLSDFGDLNLLPGNANLFNSGMYVGQTTVNPVTTSDSLLISLGRDDKITVKRSILQDLTAKQTIGTNVKETKGFEILVKNNKSVPVELEVLDNIPISQNKDIEVTLDESNGAAYVKDYGSLLWKVGLKPSESRKIRFVFTVKYPKDRQVSGI